jgi:hypothetical protein
MASVDAAPQVTPSSEALKDTTPKPPVSDDHWDDISIPFEFKKHNTKADVANVSLYSHSSARNVLTTA